MKRFRKKAGFTLAEGATHVGMYHNNGKTLNGLVKSATHVGISDNTRRVAFTLAEGATHVGISHNTSRVAFTLAEVLITLGIIGIIAVITVSVLINNIAEKQKAEQIRTIKYKFTKATENMNALGVLSPFSSTLDFVNELRKHLKIIKVCEGADLINCWPYTELNMSNGTKYPISDIVDGTSFKKRQGDWSSPAIGIVTADGTPMIFSYKKNCPKFDPLAQYAWTFEDGKPVTNATTSCIAGIFEINGKSGLNRPKKDVISFGANGVGSDCYNLTLDDNCYSDPFIPAPTNDCGEFSKSCSQTSLYYNGAIVACGGEENLPSLEELKKLANQMVIDNKFDSATAKKLGIFLEPPFSIIGKGAPHPNNKYKLNINIYNPKYPDRTVSSSYAPITTPAYVICK